MSKRLLCVDDSRAATAHYREGLSQFGFEVHTLNDPAATIDAMADVRFDCVLLDYEMPDIDGPALCEKIKTSVKYKDIPVIVLTSKDSKEYLMNAINAGADDFISKKIDLEILTYKINAAIRFHEIIIQQMNLERFRTAHAMITTYNHEINNPLAIAFGMLGKNLEEMDQYRYENVTKALTKIRDITKKIERVVSVEMEFVPYADNSEMIDLDKKAK